VTFTGNPKPLHFEAARADFAPYADKIRHVVVEGHPPAFASAWGRDFRQRDMAISALSGVCAPEDLVLLTDVDEIVDRRAIEGFEGDFAGLEMAMFRFFLNYRPETDNRPMRPTGAVVRARLLQQIGSSYARFFLARRRGGRVLGRSGWHFTSIGDAQRLVAKVNSYAHQERLAVWRDEDHVARLFADIRDGRLEQGWERAELDDSFPRYVIENQDELRDLMI
jgi:beta-1,4-mannosyl-glycoprotein beta-1,4-N-acetylglucosaminyltransferase